MGKVQSDTTKTMNLHGGDGRVLSAWASFTHRNYKLTMNRNQATQLQRDWLEACEQVGIPAITTDTSAKIMAIVYVHGGGEEEMVLNQKFVNDVKYIQRRFRIEGGEVPDETFVLTMQHYTKELEQYAKEHNTPSAIPDWAHRLMRDRYGMKLHG